MPNEPAPRLENPFTPKSLASGAGEFFGRSHDIQKLQDGLKLGHIAIHGPVGIGKSSLVAKLTRIMQGDEDTRHRSIVIQGVCSRDVKTSDQAAAMILSVLPPQAQAKHKFKVGPSFFGYENESTSGAAAGDTPMTTLQRFVTDAAPSQSEYMIFALDQAENCPTALTAFVRTLVTTVELKGCRSFRLVLSGVSPYFEKITDGDTGLNRLFTQHRVLPLHHDDAETLLETKFRFVVDQAKAVGLNVRVDPQVLEGIVRLSGGHPHLIQLLGSHLVQHENNNPDDLIDVKDLGGAIRRICYDDRSDIYNSIIEGLESLDMLRPLDKLLALAESRYPTVINRKDAMEVVGADVLNEFIKRDIFVRDTGGKLRLVDEFLSLRLDLDKGEFEKRVRSRKEYDVDEIERLLLDRFAIDDDFDDWLDTDDE